MTSTNAYALYTAQVYVYGISGHAQVYIVSYQIALYISLYFITLALPAGTLCKGVEGRRGP